MSGNGSGAGLTGGEPPSLPAAIGGNGAAGASANSGGSGSGVTGAAGASGTAGNSAPSSSLCNAASSCSAGDACCPAQCNAQTDADCSASCGDGVVQAALGETCDPKATNTADVCPSPTSCVSDNACTVAVLSGSAADCTARCTKQTITMPIGNDGCCPVGANATTDQDCRPACGNGVVESGEACDGTSGCGTDCKLTTTTTPPPTQNACPAAYQTDACTRCECDSCSAEVIACTASGNSSRDGGCRSVEACATAHDCAGSACYCGSSLLCSIAPNGACQDEIIEAASSRSWLTIQAQYLNRDSALGRAQTLGDCRRAHCSSVCP